MEAIIVRAMSLDPAARFDSVRHFGEALLQFASAGARAIWTPFFTTDSPPFTFAPPPKATTDAGRTMVLPSDAGQFAPPSSTTGSRTRSRPPVARASTTFRNATGEVVTELTPRRSRGPLLAGVGVLAVAGVLAVVISRRGAEAPPAAPVAAAPEPAAPAASPPRAAPGPAATYRIQIATDPENATLELDGQRVGSGSFADSLPADGSEHALIARAAGLPGEHHPLHRQGAAAAAVQADAAAPGGGGAAQAQRGGARRTGGPQVVADDTTRRATRPLNSRRAPRRRRKRPSSAPAGGEQPNNSPIIE